MSKPLFDFQEQLSVGNHGEKEFAQRYSELKPQKSEDRRFDFILEDKTTVELKTDTYSMDATPNFFMELYSDIDSGKIGGPWRAKEDKVGFFVYYFPRNKTFFWFKPDEVCKLVESVVAEHRLKLKSIKNKGWTAMGYAVPRELLNSVLVRKDIF